MKSLKDKKSNGKKAKLWTTLFVNTSYDEVTICVDIFLKQTKSPTEQESYVKK